MQTTTSPALDRRSRKRDRGQTTSIAADRILDIVRQHFLAEVPGVRVQEVRWSLEGVSIDHEPVAAAG